MVKSARWGAAAAALSILFSSLAFVGPASATEDDPGVPVTQADVKPAVQNCVSVALKQKNEQWTCTSEGLLVTRNHKGEAVEHFTPISSGMAPEGQDAGPSSDQLGAMSHDYDTWCEYGSICHRKISSYIHETKGNAAYGNQSGVIGSYDAVVRTNMNGRQHRWTVTLIHDSGPSLRFSYAKMRCWQDRAWMSDLHCGDRGIGSPSVSRYNRTWTSSLIYGNYLANSDDYYAQFLTNFTRYGYPTYTAGALRTAKVNCFGNDNCYFP